jgi:hypothetical protein
MAKLKRVPKQDLFDDVSRYSVVGLEDHYVVEQAVDMDGHRYGWHLLDERFGPLDRERGIMHVKYTPYLDDMRSWLDDGRDLAIHERRAQAVLKKRNIRP